MINNKYYVNSFFYMTLFFVTTINAASDVDCLDFSETTHTETAHTETAYDETGDRTLRKEPIVPIHIQQKIQFKQAQRNICAGCSDNNYSLFQDGIRQMEELSSDGYIPAIYESGFRFMYHAKNEKIRRYGFNLILNAAEKGYPFALFNVGTKYWDKTKTQEQNQGYSFIRKAAEKRLPFALYKLGVAHEKGSGAIQNYEFGKKLKAFASKYSIGSSEDILEPFLDENYWNNSQPLFTETSSGIIFTP